MCNEICNKLNITEKKEAKEMVKVYMKIDSKLVEIAIVETVEAAQAFIEMLKKNYLVAPYYYKVIKRATINQ
jgi:hypothetical protein